MLIEKALRAYLLTQSTVTTLIGSGGSARIYPVVLPQRCTFPAIKYQRISGERTSAMSGPTGTADARIQLDFYAQETGAAGYAAAKKLADAVRLVLDGYHGSMGDNAVQAAWVEGDRDGYEEATRLWRAGFDVLLTYREEAAG